MHGRRQRTFLGSPVGIEFVGNFSVQIRCRLLRVFHMVDEAIQKCLLAQSGMTQGALLCILWNRGG